MLKYYTFLLLSIFLVISILAPSIEVLCKSDWDSALVMDLNEEENNKNEKNFDEKELFFSKTIENRSFHLTHKLTRNQTYLLFYSDISAEIVHPPPRYLI